MNREYFLEGSLYQKGGLTIKCKDVTECVFCEHCAGVFWDYTNLIYTFICEEEHNALDRPCKYFKESDSE